MPNLSKKIIVFDLDGTLAESKQPLDAEMSELLDSLLKKYYVAVISGGSFEQFTRQFVSSLNSESLLLKNLILLPTSGSSMYRYEDGDWNKIYRDVLNEEEVEKIIQTLHLACQKFDIPLDTEYGPTIENRGSQVTLSPLGQHAPLNLKEVWDKDQQKRKEIVSFMTPFLPEFTITIGGMTSIDITKKGVDKAYGIHKIQEHLGLSVEEILFVGDALYAGGNDEPAKSTGVECRSVENVEGTKKIIREILSEV